MYRNLHARIETVFPIYDDQCKKIILDLLDIQLNDNVKARIINEKNTNEYKIQADDAPVIQSQLETYNYIKKITD